MHVTPTVQAMLVFECERDAALVAIPRPEVQIVVRFGALTPGGIDAHAMGVRPTAHRKVLRRGLRTVTARLRLGATAAALGVPGSVLADRITPLEDLWGAPATRRLLDQMGGARDAKHAATMLEAAINERSSRGPEHDGRMGLAVAATELLASAPVSAVAHDLGVSERHLRRVFRATLGMSPKAFVRLVRFHRALRVAREAGHMGWASVAATAGYYDQAHLIADFRALAGTTPRELLRELEAVLRSGEPSGQMNLA